jgi:WD40 repeat protein
LQTGEVALLECIHGKLADYFAERWQTSESRALSEIVFQLVLAGRMPEAKCLLLNYRWISRRLHVTPSQILSDYDLFSPNSDEAISLVRDALLLSMPRLERDPRELSAQIVGRLMGTENTEITQLIEQASKLTQVPWMRPCWPSLSQAGGRLFATLAGHNTPVSCVHLAAGGIMISGSHNGVINVWQLPNARLLRSIAAHEKSVTDLALSRDGRTGVSASSDGSLKSWDVTTGTHLKTFAGHEDVVEAVVLTFDEKYLVSGSFDRTVRIWDFRSGALQRTLRGHTAGVYCVSIAENDSLIFSGGGDATIRIWDFDTGKLLRTLTPSSIIANIPDGVAGINALAVTKDGTHLAFGTGHGAIGIWNLNSFLLVRSIQAHVDWVTGIVFTLDGNSLISVSRDGTMKRWDVTSGRLVWSENAHDGRVWSVTASEDGRILLSGGDDGLVRLWRLDSGHAVSPSHDFAVRALAVTPDGAVVVSACGNLPSNLNPHEVGSSTVCAWDGQTARLRHSMRIWLPDGPDALALAPDGKRVAIALGSSLRLWEIGSESDVRSFEGHKGDIHAVAFGRKGQHLISAGSDGTLRRWDVESAVTLDKLYIGGRTMSIAVPWDDSIAIVGKQDGTVSMWDLDKQKQVHTIQGHQGRVFSVALSPDGKIFASGAEDKLVKVWSRESGAHLHTLMGHENAVLGVAVCESGDRVYSASWDRSIRLWDVPKQECLARVTLDSMVIGLATSLDGRYVVAGDDKGIIHYFRLCSAKT